MALIKDAKIFEQIGMSQNEVKVYFALLELDQSSATPIVRKSKITNSKIYPTLDKLIERGLVCFVIKNNVHYYQASDPRNLIEFIRKKQNELKEQEQKIEEIIPLIEARRESLDEKQESFIYEGMGGIRAAFNDILNSLERGDEYFVFSLGQELEDDELKIFFGNYHSKREEQGIGVKIIAPKKLKNVLVDYKYKKMQVRFSDQALPTGIFVYGDKVMTLSFVGTPSAFVIKSRNNAQNYLKFFDEVWNKIK